LHLRPDVGVITNVEADHLDHFGSLARIHDSFVRFARNVTNGGVLLYGAEDVGATAVAAEAASRPDLRLAPFGIGAADGPGLWATEPSFAPEGSSFTPVLVGPDQSRTALRTVRLSLPGSHNVRNALGALAAAVACGADPDLAISGLEQFRGAGRRFELVGEANGLAFRDDYAHHPTEIRAAIEAARQTYPGRRLIVVFQPHLWSRTRDFMDGFADALGAADSVVLVGVYSAREKPIPGVHLRDIVKRISEAHPAKTVLCEPDKHKVADVVLWLARRGDVVMTVGAGDIREVAMDLMTRTSVEMPHEC
jgi:UDP-N-acetylmuramate--alanine ligase